MSIWFYMDGTGNKCCVWNKCWWYKLTLLICRPCTAWCSSTHVPQNNGRARLIIPLCWFLWSSLLAADWGAPFISQNNRRDERERAAFVHARSISPRNWPRAALINIQKHTHAHYILSRPWGCCAAPQPESDLTAMLFESYTPSFLARHTKVTRLCARESQVEMMR